MAKARRDSEPIENEAPRDDVSFDVASEDAEFDYVSKGVRSAVVTQSLENTAERVRQIVESGLTKKKREIIALLVYEAKDAFASDKDYSLWLLTRCGLSDLNIKRHRGLRCPMCDSPSEVYNTQASQHGRVQRYRKCTECKFRFVSTERIENESIAERQMKNGQDQR